MPRTWAASSNQARAGSLQNVGNGLGDAAPTGPPRARDEALQRFRRGFPSPEGACRKIAPRCRKNALTFTDPFGLMACKWHDIECWEDKMWAASGGSGFAGGVLAPLGSTLLEATGLSSVDRAAKDAAGGSALAMAGLILDIGSSAVPGGRQGKTAVRELIRHATDNPGAWKTVAAFVERAVSKKARGGVSIQRVIQNEAGDQLVEHTLRDKAGNVIEQHFRDHLKFVEP